MNISWIQEILHNQILDQLFLVCLIHIQLVKNYKQNQFKRVLNIRKRKNNKYQIKIK